MKRLFIVLLATLVTQSFISANIALADEEIDVLPETIARIKQSVVGIGTYKKIRRPPAIVFATGFIVMDGNHVITNAHAIPEKLDTQHKEFLALFIGQGQVATILEATVAAIDQAASVAKVNHQRALQFSFAAMAISAISICAVVFHVLIL